MPWRPKIISIGKEVKVKKVEPFHKNYDKPDDDPENTLMINTGEWAKGWYEHIDTNPVYIDSKAHLKRECEKRGLVARALAKHKSQGKGLEHKR